MVAQKVGFIPVFRNSRTMAALMGSPFLAPVLCVGGLAATDDGDADGDSRDQQHAASQQNQQKRHVTQTPSPV